MSTSSNNNNNMLNPLEKDVEKAIESVEDYYKSVDTNLDNLIQQIETMIANTNDDKQLKTTVQSLTQDISDKHKDQHGAI